MALSARTIGPTKPTASSNVVNRHVAPWAKSTVNMHSVRLTYFYANPRKRQLEDAKEHVQKAMGCPVSLAPTVGEGGIDHSVYEFSVFIPPNTPVDLVGRVAYYMAGATIES